MKRRTFLKHLAAAVALPLDAALAAAPLAHSRVALVKADDRGIGVRRAVELLQLASFRGTRVLVKPNYNSADPTPGSTHPDTLTALLAVLGEAGAATLTLADRSGMGQTRRVLEERGVFQIAARAGAQVLVLDELPASGWQAMKPPNSHWERARSAASSTSLHRRPASRGPRWTLALTAWAQRWAAGALAAAFGTGFRGSIAGRLAAL